jgi:fructuronate reductase
VLPRYAEQTLSRFTNRAISYATAKVAADGSQKLPVRLMPTVSARLAAGRSAPLSAIVFAAWVATLRGPGADTYGVTDPASHRWLSAAGSPEAGTARAEVDLLLGMSGFFPGDRADGAVGFVDDVTAAARRLWAGEVRAVLSEAMDGGGDA